MILYLVLIYFVERNEYANLNITKYAGYESHLHAKPNMHNP